MDTQVPDQFVCPILQTLFQDPVLTLDGHTFQNKAIKQWFSRGNITNPLTNNKLDGIVLIPNRCLKIAIQKFKKRLILQKEQQCSEKNMFRLMNLLEKRLKQDIKIEQKQETQQLQELRKAVAKELNIIQIEKKKIQEQKLLFQVQRKKFYNQVQNKKKIPHIQKQNNKVIQKQKIRAIQSKIIQNPKIKNVQKKTISQQQALLNIVLLGSSGSGKSTLLGSLLYRYGGIRKIDFQEFNKIKKICSYNGHKDMKYAWIVDKDKISRQKCITTYSKVKQIQTQNFKCNIIDTPGAYQYERNFLKNLCLGDIGLLVISTNPSQFKVGLYKQGCFQRSALLSFTIGIKRLIICFNKFDDKYSSYSQKIFKQMKQQVQILLKRIGYQNSNIIYIPISAWNGQNLIQKSQNMPWYNGPTLIQAINKVQKIKRPSQKPLRLIIQEVFNNRNVIVGKILSGNIKIGQKLRIAPNNILAIVKSIQIFGNPVEKAQTGQIIGIQIQRLDKNKSKISSGSVAGLINNDPPQQVQNILAQIILISVGNKIKKGYKTILNIGTASIQVQFIQLISKIDKTNGKIINQFPKYYTSSQCGIVRLKPQLPMSCQKFTNYPSLGRFSCIKQHRVQLVGVIKQIQYKNYNKK